ncbi:hypothetical protein F3Y22_tig00110013pilonHSYRG00116 [Hibiscus syriacus]|uniref:Uncharacterized protein n=1 Tax=Hibiscus syriacus TaxID=106335 RepID=A0A6A3BN28_HIBSY|nr:hypothetical protein F3Y22_tig00110013pilonHSYRG00116 [Hibiscus syriacus]
MEKLYTDDSTTLASVTNVKMLHSGTSLDNSSQPSQTRGSLFCSSSCSAVGLESWYWSRASSPPETAMSVSSYESGEVESSETSAVGALGTTYCPPYSAIDRAYNTHSSGQTSSTGSSGKENTSNKPNNECKHSPKPGECIEVHYGIVLVIMASKEDLHNATERMNNVLFYGRILLVSITKYQKINILRNFKRTSMAGARDAGAEESLRNKSLSLIADAGKKELMNKFYDGRTYKDMVVGVKEVEGQKVGSVRAKMEAKKPLEVFILMEDRTWLRSSLTGICKEIFEVDFVQRALRSEGINVEVVKWGYAKNACLIVFQTWRKKLQRWKTSGKLCPFGSRVSFFTSLASRWGKLVKIQEQTIQRVDCRVAHMLLRVESPFDIPSYVYINTMGRSLVAIDLCAEETIIGVVPSQKKLSRDGREEREMVVSRERFSWGMIMLTKIMGLMLKWVGGMVQSPAEGASGGLVTLWDENWFLPQKLKISLRFIAMKGTIKDNQEECCFINVYRPSVESDTEGDSLGVFWWEGDSLGLLLPKSISDHNVVALESSKLNWGSKPFRIFNYIMEEEGFKEAVERKIHIKSRKRPSIEVLIRETKVEIKNWSNEIGRLTPASVATAGHRSRWPEFGKLSQTVDLYILRFPAMFQVPPMTKWSMAFIAIDGVALRPVPNGDPRIMQKVEQVLLIMNFFFLLQMSSSHYELYLEKLIHRVMNSNKKLNKFFSL